MADQPQMQKGIVAVCVNDHPRIIALLRRARYAAQMAGLPWTALHIDSPETAGLSNDRRIRVLQSLTLAEEMGASLQTVTAKNQAHGLELFLKNQEELGAPVQVLYLGQEESEVWLDILKPPVAARIRERLSPNARLEVVKLNDAAIPRRSWIYRLQPNHFHFIEIFYALGAVLLAAAAIAAIEYMFPEAFSGPYRNRPIIFMIAVAFAAGRYGLIPGLAAAVASFFALNIIYTWPFSHLMIDDVSDVLNFGLFLAGGCIIAMLVSGTRASREQMARQLERMQALFRMYRLTLRTHTIRKTLEALHEEFGNALKAHVVFFLRSPVDPETLELAYPDEPLMLENDEKAALTLCWEEAKVTGFGTGHFLKSTYRFRPLLTPSTAIGVMAIRFDPKTIIDESFSTVITGITDSIALIIERLMLGQAMEEGRVREEREKLRAMLLSSVSHDLKTPLASVIGSLSVYRNMGKLLPEEQRIQLIQTAMEEAQRLDSFITNILDMTRLESGQISFKQEWIKPDEIMGNVQKRLKDKLSRHQLVVQKDTEETIELCVDSVMIEQVLQNILDNAAKYTQAGTRIEVLWKPDDNGLLRLMVRDWGSGIPEDGLERVFDKYARIRRQDSQVAGTGLGLAIARAVMNAQGGRIEAGNHERGGAVFTLIFPKWRHAEPDKRAA